MNGIVEHVEDSLEEFDDGENDDEIDDSGDDGDDTNEDDTHDDSSSSQDTIIYRCRSCGHQVSILQTFGQPTRPPTSCQCCRIINSFSILTLDQLVVTECAPAPATRIRPKFHRTNFNGSSQWSPFKNTRFDFQSDNPERARVVDPSQFERTPYVRTPTGMDGFDHVLGGGLACGYVVMIAGAPGTGKSTACTQMAASIQELGTHFGEGVAYGSAEEDEEAVIETAQRVAKANFKIVLSTSVQELIEVLDSTGAVVWVIDSLMTITSDHIRAEPGLPSQINACATLLYQRSHATGPYKGRDKRSILLVAHGTKDGDLAGPMKALHAVDGAVLIEHLDPFGDLSKGRPPWSVAPDQTRPTGFVGARVFRKMRKASNRRESYFKIQSEYMDDEMTELNPIGGRLDRIDGPGIDADRTRRMAKIAASKD